MVTDTSRAVMQQALEFLENAYVGELVYPPERDELCEALRAELAKPVPEYSDIVSDGGLDPRNVYLEPVQQKGNMHTEYLR
jgi:hypothetical protein